MTPQQRRYAAVMAVLEREGLLAETPRLVEEDVRRAVMEAVAD